MMASSLSDRGWLIVRLSDRDWLPVQRRPSSAVNHLQSGPAHEPERRHRDPGGDPARSRAIPQRSRSDLEQSRAICAIPIDPARSDAIPAVRSEAAPVIQSGQSFFPTQLAQTFIDFNDA